MDWYPWADKTIIVLFEIIKPEKANILFVEYKFSKPYCNEDFVVLSWISPFFVTNFVPGLIYGIPSDMTRMQNN